MKTEEEIFQESVMDLCAIRHLSVVHINKAKTPRGNWITPTSPDGKGWPDLSICGPGGLIFRELKARRGRLEPEQREWLMRLTRAGQDAAVWRPADMESGLIPDTLQRLAKPRPSTESEQTNA